MFPRFSIFMLCIEIESHLSSVSDFLTSCHFEECKNWLTMMLYNNVFCTLKSLYLLPLSREGEVSSLLMTELR